MSKNKAKEASTSFAVAVTTGSVPDALDALRAELKSLNDISETSYKTGGDGKVTGFPNSIQTETSVENLIKMHSSAFGRAKAYDASLGRLTEVGGVSIVAPCFRDNGSSLESIEYDIALRIKVLNVSERRAELQSLLKEAEGFLTKEDQFKMFQKKLGAALGFKEEA